MKLVILDCDGTLVDSQNGICAAMTEAFGALGLAAPTRAATLAIVGLSLPEAFAALAPEHDRRMHAALAERYCEAFRDRMHDPELADPPFAGIVDAIAALGGREDVMLGLATGKSRRGVDRLFAREGWAQRFSTVQTADDHPSKPHPAMLLAAMAETGIDPHRTVMVGDTTFDMQMARAAGVGALGVGWGYHDAQELRGAGAHGIVEAAHDLHEAVERYFALGEEAA